MAVARERKAAAPQRVTELARLNDSLRRSVSGLAAVDHIHGFFRVALAEMAAIIRADNGALMIFDARERSFRMVCAVPGDEEQVLAGDAHDRRWSLDDPFVANVWATIVAAEAPLMTAIESDLVAPDIRDRHRGRGDQAIVYVPVRRGSEALGFIAFGCRHSTEPPSVSQELAVALAHHIALAVELDRLGTEAREAALALERETAAQQRETEEKAREAVVAMERERNARDRVDELAKVNDILRRGLDEVADLRQLDAFAASTLREGTSVLKADSAVLILHQEAKGSYRPVAFINDGHVWSHEEIAADPFLGNYERMSLLDPGGIFSAFAREPVARIFVVESHRDLWPEAYDFHVRFGHVVRWVFPLCLRGRILGFLVFAQRGPHPPSAAQVEIASALVQQLTLALQIIALADKAREEAEQAAVTAERNRLARELHDTLAQGFTAITMQLLNVARERAQLPKEVVPYFDTALALARENLAEARRSVKTLRPDSMGGGFAATLRELIEKARRLTAARINLEATTLSIALPRNVEDELLRIVQEALSNAARHSRATSIEVRVESQEGIRISVEDNGCGFDADAPTAGYGLMGMQERAEQIGATVTVVTEDRNGTTVIVAWAPPVVEGKGTMT